ncbi:hypothetical protein FLGE108171_05750 [Flavobacterium gelidilacus]|jgi:hypothetical protein|uniref:hypothetical protein n=1 Tax=Flavobacterium gelidilacus TaxID=206041 RepID=UPI00041BF2E3|nr:hypothetical protein [Flavobacterium gelidilacus]
MLNLFKKVVKKISGQDEPQKNLVDIFTEEKVSDYIGDKIASHETGGIWIKVQEIAEFHFLNVTIVGTQNIKTQNGITFDFIAKDKTYELNSDTKEIKSEPSTVSNQFVTQFSFDITEVDFDIMLTEGITIEVKSNKQTEEFIVIKE